ncbi:DUF481 domain-containing protein [Candidatus Aminicenantes bacterium AC-334-K16]|nr:DUF481 domain-containing protein [Candidatus Aminicenantes bacterium AC-334-K16]
MREKHPKKFFKNFNRGIGKAIVLLMIFPLMLGAEEKGKENKEKTKSFQYKSNTALSLVMTRGNSESFSLSMDTDHNFYFYKNKINFKGRFIKATSTTNKTEVYYVHLKYDRNLNSRAYLLGFSRFERNRQAGYDYRIALSFGGGCNWIKKKNTELSSEAAIGWNNEDTSRRINLKNINNTSAVIEKTMNAAFVSALMVHRWIYQINDSARIQLQGTIFLNLEDLLDYRTNSYAAITTSISKYFALNTSLQVIFERKPVPGYKHTDLYLLSSFVVKL